MITRATLPDGRVLDLASPLAFPEPPTLLGMPVYAGAGMPSGEIWCVGLGNPPRILGKIVNIGTEAPDAPPDAAHARRDA